MATQQTRTLARFMLAPSVLLLLVWMIVPLVFTLWFSFQHYNLLNPINDGFVGLSNYVLFYSNPAFLQSIVNTLVLVVSVLVITVVGGILLALLLDQPMWGQGIVRILVISPFFVMPPVAALVWKNMIMHPGYGVFADIARFFGAQPIDWFAQYPLFSIILIVAWQWLPFATLILLTSLQSLDGEQKEAAEMDGAGFLSPLLVSDAAAPGARHHRGHADPDDLPARRLRGNPRHHQWRPRLRLHQPAVPRLPEGPARLQNRPGVRRRHHRRHPRQHRRHLPDARRRQEPRSLNGQEKDKSMARAVTTQHKTVATVAAWIVAFLIFFPILYTIITSFKSETEAIAGFSLIPSGTLESYGEVQSQYNYFKPFMNSVILSVGSTILALLVAVPAAWSMAFSPTKRTKDILMWMLSTKMMPAVAVLVPIYLIFRTLGLLDSRIGLTVMLMLINLPIVVWMLYTYFREIPGEILEAARMDGATLWGEIVYVLTPMAVPGIASTMLLNIILAWNEAFWTIRLTTTNAAPLTAFISSFSSPQGLFWAKLSAASTLAIAPILIMGWFSQKQLVRGLTFGAVK